LDERAGPIDFPRIDDQPVIAAVSSSEERDRTCGCFWSWKRCDPAAAPDMYTSRKARLYSANFHSPRKPRVPMLKDSIGGTLVVVENKEDAWRIVPSPPRVVVMSTFLGRLDVVEVVYTGKEKDSWSFCATSGSKIRETLS
jgi:hypothetical protein